MKNIPAFATRFAVLLFLAGGINARAASYSWAQAAGGIYSWTGTQNWTPNSGFPNAAGDTASLNNNISTSGTITLNQAVTLGTLNIGDADGSAAFVVQTGSLFLQGANSGNAVAINLSTLGNSLNTIAAPVYLGGTNALYAAPLTVTTTGTQRLLFSSTFFGNGNAITLFTGMTTNNEGTAGVEFGSVLSGSGKIVKQGGGALRFSGSNSFTGPVEVRQGVLFQGGATGYFSGTDLTIFGDGSAGRPVDSNAVGVAGATYFKVGSNGAGGSGRLNPNLVVTLRGGGFYEGGSTTSGFSDNIKELKIAEGTGILAGRSTGTLTMTDLTRAKGTTLTIRTDTTLRLMVTNSGSSGLIGGGGSGTSTSVLPWAIESNNLFGDGTMDFVTYTSGTGLRALVASEYTNVFTGSATNNVSVGNTTLAASSTINVLKYTGASALALGANTLTVTSGGVLFQNTGSITGAGTLNFGANEGIIHTVGSNTNAINAVIGGSGGLTKGNTGALILGGANTFTGTVTVAGGVLRIGNTNALSVNNDVVLANTSNVNSFGTAINWITSLDLNNFNLTVGSLAGGGAVGGNVLLGTGTLTTGGGNLSTVYSGSIVGAGGLVKNGTGTQTLDGTNGYTGPTQINNGTVQLGNGGTTGSITSDVTTGSSSAILAFNRSDAYAFGNTITGSGQVRQVGTGTTTLSANNSYAGGTRVNAGTLLVIGTSAVGVGGVDLEGGSLRVNIASGTFAVTNAVTFTGTSARYVLERAAGSNYAAYSARSDLAGGQDTIASLLDGAAGNVGGGSRTLSTTFDIVAASGLTPSNDADRVSDVFTLEGTKAGGAPGSGGDVFVLQLQIADVSAGTFLAWLNGSNTWVNAVLGNSNAGTMGLTGFQGDGAYNPGTDFVLGYWGYDTAADTVWAVLDHNSEFAALTAVPEPAAGMLVGLGLAVLLRRRRR